MFLNFLKILFKKRQQDEFEIAYANLCKNTTKSLEEYHNWEYDKVRSVYNSLMQLYNQFKNEIDLGNTELEADCDIVKYYITVLNIWDFINSDNRKTRLQTLYCANDISRIASINLTKYFIKKENK